MGGGAEEAGGEGAAVAGRLLVFHVQNRRHLVAILGLEAAGRKLHVAGEVKVDEAESFLLSAAHEEGTVDLYVVDKDEVFVVVPASHVVLAAQLVGGRGAGHRLDEGFHPPRGRGHFVRQLRVDAGVRIVVRVGYGNSFQYLSRWGHEDAEGGVRPFVDAYGDDGVAVGDAPEQEVRPFVGGDFHGELALFGGDGVERVVVGGYNHHIVHGLPGRVEDHSSKNGILGNRHNRRCPKQQGE